MVGLLPSGEQPALISLAITRELELVGSFRFNDEIDEVFAALADGSLASTPSSRTSSPPPTPSRRSSWPATRRAQGKVLLRFSLSIAVGCAAAESLCILGAQCNADVGMRTRFTRTGPRRTSAGWAQPTSSNSLHLRRRTRHRSADRRLSEAGFSRTRNWPGRVRPGRLDLGDRAAHDQFHCGACLIRAVRPGSHRRHRRATAAPSSCGCVGISPSRCGRTAPRRSAQSSSANISLPDAVQHQAVKLDVQLKKLSAGRRRARRRASARPRPSARRDLFRGSASRPARRPSARPRSAARSTSAAARPCRRLRGASG